MKVSIATLVALSIPAVPALAASRRADQHARLRSRTPSGDCKCGYSRNGAYFSGQYSIDFTQVTTPAAISAAGMWITDTYDYAVGVPNPDGTIAVGQASNIRPAGGDGIALVVPGGQSGSHITGAELSYQGPAEGMNRIYTESEFIVDPTPGTCQALFTFTQGYQSQADEQDIEIIAASLMTGTSIAPAGVQLTNHDPSKSGKTDQRIQPFPEDPSKAFHTYSIDWANGQVQYAFDGKPWTGPTGFVSVNPSHVILNHWATGYQAFFGAPLPSKDVVMKVRNLKVYYSTPSTSNMPAGCSQADVCPV